MEAKEVNFHKEHGKFTVHGQEPRLGMIVFQAFFVADHCTIKLSKSLSPELCSQV